MCIDKAINGGSEFSRGPQASMSACDDSANEWMPGQEVKHKGSVVMLLTSHFLWTRALVRDASALSSAVHCLNSFDVDSEQLLLLFLNRRSSVRSFERGFIPLALWRRLFLISSYFSFTGIKIWGDRLASRSETCGTTWVSRPLRDHY